MKPERLEKFRQVIASRQPDLTVVLENVHDQHNIGAVMRTCDSVGICEIYILQSHPDLRFSNLTLGKRTSAGTRKWVDVHYFKDREACFASLREKFNRIYATHLDASAHSLYDLNLVEPTALLFGNERDGVSPETLGMCDGNFLIPQVGMVQSLNISVACAVSLYEAYRQRRAQGLYEPNPGLSTTFKDQLLDTYVERHEGKVKNKKVLPKGLDIQQR